jgi:hypothetical protein
VLTLVALGTDWVRDQTSLGLVSPVGPAGCPWISITDSAVPFVIVSTFVPSIEVVGALHRPFGNCRKFPVARALLSVQVP